MIEESREEKAAPPHMPTRWLVFGFGATGVWTLGLAWHLFCNQPGGWIEAPHALPRELNALGDFLAGAFAPVAFLWLFIAVMVQSKELSLQRQELGATRSEMRENRRVAEAQAAYIGNQTELLRSEQRRGEWEVADRHAAMLQMLAVESVYPRVRVRDHTGGFWTVDKKPRGLPSENDEKFLTMLALVDNAASQPNAEEMRQGLGDKAGLERLLSRLQELIIAAVSVSPERAEFYKAANLERAIVDLRKLVDCA